MNKVTKIAQITGIPEPGIVHLERPWHGAEHRVFFIQPQGTPPDRKPLRPSILLQINSVALAVFGSFFLASIARHEHETRNNDRCHSHERPKCRPRRLSKSCPPQTYNNPAACQQEQHGAHA